MLQVLFGWFSYPHHDIFHDNFKSKHGRKVNIKKMFVQIGKRPWGEFTESTVTLQWKFLQINDESIESSIIEGQLESIFLKYETHTWGVN